MTCAESLNRYGLVPADASLPAIRQMLEREAELERIGKGYEREEDLALLCCVQLFSRGLLEDVFLIWEARESGWDLHSYLDTCLVCGAGVQQTREFLLNHSSPEATVILAAILAWEESGGDEGWSPSNYLEFYQNYFGLR